MQGKFLQWSLGKDRGVKQCKHGAAFLWLLWVRGLNI